MEPIVTKEIDGLTIKIHADEYPESPRSSYEPLGTILYKKGSRYTLGDDEATEEEMDEIAASPDNVVLPVYAYIHSGIAMNTTGFSCPWDSGRCGIIYISKEKIRSEYGVKAITKKIREKVISALQAEIEEFSAYLNGDVYGYTVEDKNGEELESCWGYYGIESALEEAIATAKVHANETVGV